MINRDIPVSPEIFFNGILDHWDVPTAHEFVLRLAREWGYESFALDLAKKLYEQEGYEVEYHVDPDHGETPR